jgi:hypothetical protein
MTGMITRLHMINNTHTKRQIVVTLMEIQLTNAINNHMLEKRRVVVMDMETQLMGELV